MLPVPASTFKPLNSTETLKKPDKSRKKSRRTTIMGIPQQVQREIGAYPTLMNL